jgi:hypothetical protein
VNAVISKRFAKRQQMQWTERGAHPLLQMRTRALDGTLRPQFERWYPGLANDIAPGIRSTLRPALVLLEGPFSLADRRWKMGLSAKLAARQDERSATGRQPSLTAEWVTPSTQESSPQPCISGPFTPVR